MGKKKTVKEKQKSWWQKLLCELAGLSLIIFPLLMYISLFSYNANDPSFNKTVSSDAAVQNWLGLFGAYSADFVLIRFGVYCLFDSADFVGNRTYALSDFCRI